MYWNVQFQCSPIVQRKKLRNMLKTISVVSLISFFFHWLCVYNSWSMFSDSNQVSIVQKDFQFNFLKLISKYFSPEKLPSSAFNFIFNLGTRHEWSINCQRCLSGAQIILFPNQLVTFRIAYWLMSFIIFVLFPFSYCWM